MRIIWRRFGSWITPVAVAIEIILVWTGVLSLLEAAVVLVVVEALLAIVVLSRAAVAVRSVRRTRTESVDWWTAVESGVAELVPRTLARVLLIEARMWVCAMDWFTRRRPPGRRVFGYGANLRMMMYIVVALVVLEAAVFELLLVLLLGRSSPWVWLGLALHLYGLVWVIGFLGSLRMLPHRIEDDMLILRDSVFTAITIPLAAVSQVQARERGYAGRSGFRLDGDTALLTYGDANVRVVVDATDGVRINGEIPPSFGSIDLSLDDRRAFVDALREHAARVRRSTNR